MRDGFAAEARSAGRAPDTTPPGRTRASVGTGSWWDREALGVPRRARRVPRGRHGRGTSSGVPEGLREARRRAARRRRRAATCSRWGAARAQCSRWLAARGARVVGLDLSGGDAREAGRRRRRPARRPLVQADARALPVRRRAFDLACSAYGAVPFVADPERIMREVARVLRPGGRWVFSVTHPMRWAFPDDPGPAGLRRDALVLRPDARTWSWTTRARALRRAPPHPRRPRGGSRRARASCWSGSWSRSGRRGRHVWGGWSALRGRLLPGTLILVTRRTPRPEERA